VDTTHPLVGKGSESTIEERPALYAGVSENWVTRKPDFREDTF
jgi:hypothetical protein